MGELENERETESDLRSEEEAEAEREAALTEDEPKPEGEPAPEGEPPSEPEEPEAEVESETTIDDAFKKLARSATNWRNRVSELIPEEAQLLFPCPLCEPAIPGFVMKSPDTPERFPAVAAFIGIEAEPALEPDPTASVCPTCKGWGNVATGSKTDAHKSMECPECHGNGAIGPRFAKPQPPIPAPAPGAAQNGPPSPTLTAEEEAVAAQLRAKGVVVYVPPVVS